jgi:hypothetical protein
MKNLHIVYYSYIGGDDVYFPNGKYHWKKVIKGQINDIKESELLKQNDTPGAGAQKPEGIRIVCKLYLIICSEKKFLLDEATKLIEELMDPKIDFTLELETVNRFEYPGIKKVYELGCANKDDIILYLHSKQLGHSNVLSNGRGQVEMICLQNTIKRWKDILTVFDLDKRVEKVCLFPSTTGFSWINFFWTRGSYVARCSDPIITQDRYYYERWLGEEGSKTWTDCYNLCKEQIESVDENQIYNYLFQLSYKM